MNNKIFFIELENHSTKSTVDNHVNGKLTVIWRDWDNIIKNHPKMVYVSSVNPRELKGPHIHTKRNSYFVCIHGKVVFVVRQNDGKYLEIESSYEKPVLVYVPKNIASAHLNLSKNISLVLALTDLAWRPNDNEVINVNFDNYDWRKWKEN